MAWHKQPAAAGRTTWDLQGCTPIRQGACRRPERGRRQQQQQRVAVGVLGLAQAAVLQRTLLALLQEGLQGTGWRAAGSGWVLPARGLQGQQQAARPQQHLMTRARRGRRLAASAATAPRGWVAGGLQWAVGWPWTLQRDPASSTCMAA